MTSSHYTLDPPTSLPVSNLVTDDVPTGSDDGLVGALDL